MKLNLKTQLYYEEYKNKIKLSKFKSLYKDIIKKIHEANEKRYETTTIIFNADIITNISTYELQYYLQMAALQLKFEGIICTSITSTSIKLEWKFDNIIVKNPKEKCSYYSTI